MEAVQEPQGIQLDEILAMLRRRALRALLVSVACACVGIPIALLWPPVYRSTATILIEEQEIPRDLVRSTVTSFADERIQVISQQVMTRATLMQIADKYDLYKRERRYLSNDEIIERMRKDVNIANVNAEVSDRRSGARGATTIAFRLSFENREPAKAQRVANELVTLYLNENLKTRQQRADDTSAFLGEEAQRLAAQISETERELATFKRANTGKLPELMQVNVQLREKAEAELVDLDRQIRLLEDRKAYMEAQLGMIRQGVIKKDPVPGGADRIADPEERLKLLRTQLASLTGVYSDRHPDVVRLRREISSLEKTVSAKGGPDPKKIEEARQQLLRLAERYSEDHPDVIRQRKVVAALDAEAALARTATKPRADTAEDEGPTDNPMFVTLSVQLRGIENEIKSLAQQKETVRERLAQYTARIEQTPEVEQRYLDLTRDHTCALAKYREIRSKQMEAEVARELEKDRKAERFSLIDPPQFPEKPHKPNRPVLLGFALAASLGGGVGIAALTEFLDRSVRSARSLAALLEVPVLASIPRVQNAADLRRRRRRLIFAAIAVVLLAMLGLALVHFAFIPLDSLWFVLLRRLQL